MADVTEGACFMLEPRRVVFGCPFAFARGERTDESCDGVANAEDVACRGWQVAQGWDVIAPHDPRGFGLVDLRCKLANLGAGVLAEVEDVNPGGVGVRTTLKRSVGRMRRIH